MSNEERKMQEEQPTDKGTREGPKHPAKYSDAVMMQIKFMLAKHVLPRYPDKFITVLDPFAGTGKIHDLRDWAEYDIGTVGIEIEPEWANMRVGTALGDALTASKFIHTKYHAIVTSPCYGNRMADHHNARDTSVRNTYRHKLGRPLTPGSSGELQWGIPYRDFHVRAWLEMNKLVRPEGNFILNVSNHIRKGVEQRVSEWHADTLTKLGWELLEDRHVDTPRLRYGENDRARVSYEHVYVFKATDKLRQELTIGQHTWLINNEGGR